MHFACGIRLAAALGAAALGAATPSLALAQTPAPTSIVTFAVTATVSTTCFVTATSLDFGPYTSAQLDGTSTISATCSSGTPYDLGLNQGTGAGATVSTRVMTDSVNELLQYSLFRDSGRTLNWGNTVGTDTVHSTGTGAVQPFTVYGRIPASQFVAAGNYSDTITVTLTF